MDEPIPENWDDAIKAAREIAEAGGDPRPYLNRWLPGLGGRFFRGDRHVLISPVVSRTESSWRLFRLAWHLRESPFRTRSPSSWGRWAELMDERRLTFYSGNKEMPDDPYGVPVGKIDFFDDPR